MRAGLAALLLAGCPSVGPREWASVEDRDGDGEPSDRFGGRDCVDTDPSISDCDVDRDGFLSVAAGGDDCDDRDADVRPDVVWYRDADGDGHGDPDQTVAGCRAPLGYVSAGDDCDDTLALVFPGQEEACDDLDLDCSGDPYDVARPPAYFVDADGDGFGVGSPVGNHCVAPPGHAHRTGDCDDTEPGAHPGAVERWYDGIDADCLGDDDFDQDGDGFSAAIGGGPDCDDRSSDVNPDAAEVCDGRDDDCDGAVDEGTFPDASGGAAPFYPDGDGDGFGDPAQPPVLACPGTAWPGFVDNDLDCDDGTDQVSPFGAEHCNGVDDDCDGEADENAVDALIAYVDADGDGWGSTEVEACFVGPGQSDRAGDCQDQDPTFHPGAPEVCGDAVRQDCRTDVTADDCDADGVPAPVDCLDDPGVYPRAAEVHPGATEVCNGVDDDCDGLLDGEEITNPFLWPDWYLDLDGDGFGGPTLAATRTCSAPPFAAPGSDDCDDARASVFPGAVEVCDGRDDDCDGDVDDVDAADAPPWYGDGDGDGFGAGVSARACLAPPGSVAFGGDCDDGDPAVSPLGVEVCNAVDDDCDGRVDAADDLDERVWRDLDGDGAGAVTSMPWCGLPPAGWSATGDDCDDGDPARAPGLDEVCDGFDDDCDGLADEADPSLIGLMTVFPDLDLDGYGDEASPTHACANRFGYVATGLDCDDLDPGVNPDGQDTCERDRDCDGIVAPDPAARPLLFVDADGDGFGSSIDLAPGCPGDAGLAALGGDCDDGDADVFPAQLELCNQIDDDCNGLADDGTADLDPLAPRWYEDADRDGFTGASDTFCHPPDAGWVRVPSAEPDCDDGDPLRSPGLPELCRSGDNDCDPSTTVGVDAVEGYLDEDGDGYGIGPLTTLCPPNVAGVAGDCDDTDDQVQAGGVSCQDGDGDGFVDLASCTFSCAPGGGLPDPGPPYDCDDGDPGIHPGADPTGFECDAIDQDCDGVDEGFAGYQDLDRDGYGSTVPAEGCPGDPWTIDATDCDDGSALAHPGGTEVCDGLDNDCANGPDDGGVCGGGGGLVYWYDDDGDGLGDPLRDPVLLPSPQTGYVDNPLDCDDTVSDPLADVYGVQVSTTAELNTALGQAAPCLVIDVDASFTIGSTALLPPAVRRHLRRAVGTPTVLLTQGNTAGAGLQVPDGLVLHEIDLAASSGGMNFAAPLAASGVSTRIVLSHLDLNGQNLGMRSFVTGASDFHELVTGAVTVHDALSAADPVFDVAGTQHHFGLDVQDVALLMIQNAGTVLESLTGANVGTWVGQDFGKPLPPFAVHVVSSVNLAEEFDIQSTNDWDLQDVHVASGSRAFTFDTISGGVVTISNSTFTGDVVGQGMFPSLVLDQVALDGSLRLSGSSMAATVVDSAITAGGVQVGDGASIDLAMTRVVVSDSPGHGVEVGTSSGSVAIDLVDVTVLRPAQDGVHFASGNFGSPGVLRLLRGLIVDAGDDGVEASGLTIRNSTIVGSASSGVVKGGVYAAPTVRDSIVWGSSPVDMDLGTGTGALTNVFFGTKAAGVIGTSVGTAPYEPGFARYAATAPSSTWDLHLHPNTFCSADTWNTSSTGAYVGALPPLAAASVDGDSLPDAWETVWFGAPGMGDDTGDEDSDAIPNDQEYLTCGFPTPYP